MTDASDLKDQEAAHIDASKAPLMEHLIELPADLGAAGPDDYAAAGALVTEWRREGILVKDAEPTVTVHQMRWADGEGRSHTATGLLVRLRLEEGAAP